MKKVIFVPSVLVLSFLLTFNQQIFPQDEIAENKETVFEFPHSVNRLFSVPTSRVMNSLDFSLMLGGSFGFTDNSGLLGTIALGLGGYGDIELGSESLLGSVFTSNESFTNVGMRIKIFSEENHIPGISVGIKANNDWNSSRNDAGLIRTSSPELFNGGLRAVNYDSRMTSLFAAFSKKLKPVFTIHLGVNYSDLRYRNIYTIFNESSVYSNNDERKENVWNFFAGFEYELSSRTILMLEAQTFPYLKPSTIDGTLSSARRVVTVFGLRFFVSKWLLVDSGIRYQDNYSGLADAELRIGLNGIWNAGF